MQEPQQFKRNNTIKQLRKNMTIIKQDLIGKVKGKHGRKDPLQIIADNQQPKQSCWSKISCACNCKTRCKAIFKASLYHRKLLRISILLSIATFTIIMCILFYWLFAFQRGTLIFGNNESASIALTSCSFFIYDHSMLDTLTLDTNLFGTTAIPSSLGSNEYAFLQYFYPARSWFTRKSTFSEVIQIDFDFDMLFK